MFIWLEVSFEDFFFVAICFGVFDVEEVGWDDKMLISYPRQP